MKRNLSVVSTLLLLGGLAALPRLAQAQPASRAPVEVIGWADDGSVVVFAERRSGERRGVDAVARRVPSGEILARRAVSPGPCARVIDRRVAIQHACALAEIRDALPASLLRMRYHAAAEERSRMFELTLRGDGAVVEHELPRLGLVLRGRTERDGRRRMAVLEVSRIGRREGGRVLDRRPVSPSARRRWLLLEAGDSHVIVVGPGLLRRISRPATAPPPAATPTPAPQSHLARSRLVGG